MKTIRKITRTYAYPSHAITVFNRIAEDLKNDGYGLLAIEKDYLLGCGFTFRFFGISMDEIPEYQLIPIYGRLRRSDDQRFDGCQIKQVLSMKLLWFAVGYFYLLERCD